MGKKNGSQLKAKGGAESPTRLKRWLVDESLERNQISTQYHNSR